jgi:hypothetical protein
VREHAPLINLISRTQQGCFILVSQDFGYISPASVDEQAPQLRLHTSPLSRVALQQIVILVMRCLPLTFAVFRRLQSVSACRPATSDSFIPSQVNKAELTSQTPGLVILDDPALRLCSQVTVFLLLTGSRSVCDALACSSDVLPIIISLFVDAASCPLSKGPLLQSIFSQHFKRAVVHGWLSEHHMCKCPGARSGCVLLTPHAAFFSVPGSIFLLCLTCSYLPKLFRYATDFPLSCSVLMLNQWPRIAGLAASTRTQALHTFRGISAYPCLPKTQRIYFSQSCGSWNHRTAHREGAERNTSYHFDSSWTALPHLQQPTIGYYLPAPGIPRPHGSLRTAR